MEDGLVTAFFFCRGKPEQQRRKIEKPDGFSENIKNCAYVALMSFHTSLDFDVLEHPGRSRDDTAEVTITATNLLTGEEILVGREDDLPEGR